MTHAKIEELICRDPRYDYRAYEFVFEALEFAAERLGRLPPEGAEVGEGAPDCRHLSGRELLEGICDLARREFGLMAPTVFRLWGVERTADFGEIVFNLVDAGLMSKTDQDSRADFRDVFDLGQALVGGYEIKVEEAE